MRMHPASFLGLTFLLALPAAADDVTFRADGDALRFGNGRVELTLDAKSGYFREIVNVATGIHHKKPDDGVWPFGLWVGTREKPEQMRAEIRADGVQRMTHALEDGAGGLKRLALTYPMLVDNKSRAPTGVGLGVWIELAPGREYFALRAEIANAGPLGVTNFYAAQGEGLTGEISRADETVWIPTRGGTPRSRFSGAVLGFPTYTWGWMDCSGKHGGLGIACLNKQGIQMVFDLKPTPDGLVQSWRLFDTRGYWHFENLYDDRQKALRIQPLEAGSTFATDEWLIIPHAGDWHRTADAYRERYAEVFKGDYLDWARLPEKVRRLHFQIGIFVAENSIGNSYPRKVVTPLDAIPPEVERILRGTGADPARVSVNAAFNQPHVGRYPEFFPVWGPAGGDEGWKRMVERLHAMGIAYVMGYTHLAYDHPAAKNYVPEADASEYVPTFNPTAGRRACVDNAAWVRLWRDELIPAYRERRFDAVYADEGHFPWGMCAGTGAGHLHGVTAPGILSANSRGVLRLHKLLHEGLGPESVIMVEGAGDVSGRWVDVGHAYPDPAVPYSLPFKRLLWNLDAQTPEPTLQRNVNVCLALGYALMFNSHPEHTVADYGPLRRYVEARNRLEADRAPGYPQGFRDTVGVTTSAPALVAKAFRDDTGITVVYYAEGPVEGEIAVDAAALGHPGLGATTRTVKLEKDGFGYFVLRPR